ncbi:MAG TPA: hypothetical protein VK163_15735 [Opitutaceae bacterium]|nr:hypothetical protein [Opitutaceae bacterium]
MKKMDLRLLGWGVLCLAIGTVAGYRLGTAGSGADRPAEPLRKAAVAANAGAASSEAPAGVGAEDAVARGAPIDPQRPKLVERLEALRWFNRNGGAWFRVGVFSSPQRGELAAGFVSAYGLTAEEGRLLREALTAAREKMDRGRLAAAKVEVRSDNLGAVIEVPALPELGGAAYDDVLATFRAVLGPERWEYFDEFSADGFEHGFLSFGAMQTKIEIEVKQFPGGAQYFDVKDHYVGPDGSGWSGGTVDPASFRQSYPFAAKLLPEAFLRAQPKP